MERERLRVRQPAPPRLEPPAARPAPGAATAARLPALCSRSWTAARPSRQEPTLRSRPLAPLSCVTALALLRPSASRGPARTVARRPFATTGNTMEIRDLPAVEGARRPHGSLPAA